MNKQTTNPAEVTALAKRVITWKTRNGLTWKTVSELFGMGAENTTRSLISKAYYDGNSLSQKRMNHIMNAMEAYDAKQPA